MTTTYRVRWMIDVEAESREEAARKALAIQQRPVRESIAHVFDVQSHTESRDVWETIDLDALEGRVCS
jgi:hypothetical protein